MIRPPFRVENIGSFVRPQALLEARARHADGRIGDDELRRVEDEEIARIAAWQRERGLRSITDGEFRRASYSDGFGRSAFPGLESLPSRDPQWRYTNAAGEASRANAAVVRERLIWRGPVNAADFEYLASVVPADCVPKMTLPGPCYIHFRAGRENMAESAYPDLDLFWSDIVDGYANELAALRDSGCRYVQLDETSIAKFADNRIRAALAERGDRWEDLLEIYTDVINEVAARAPAGLELGLHLCRGNKGGAWQAEGGYEHVAASLFRKLAIGAYYLEYDSPRAGGFEPLREVPDGKIVVLGLVSTKVRALERIDDLRRRVEEAARFVPLDRLGVSTQCGFAGDVAGTGLDAADQTAKIDLLFRFAKEIWGEAATEPVRA